MRWFAKYGDWITFVTRLLPAVRTFISLPAGVARMNIWKFSFYAFTGAFIWSAALTYGGYVLGQNWESLREASAKPAATNNVPRYSGFLTKA